MRPTRLALQGLRSYRQHQEIDFSGASLVAILGDTGAGKSSILEALCVALYAASTWDKRNAKVLISAGAQSLDVELDFLADGKLWRVTRSLPAGNYPAATHQLVGLDDGSRIDGAKEVNARVQDLVGLDYDAFLRAVLLPQGRFQALLQATSGDRTSILKGIFRLDLLERVRDGAQSRLERLEPRFQELRAQRQVLLADPVATAAAAGRRRDEAARQCAALDVSLDKVRALTTRRDEVGRSAAQLEAAVQRIREVGRAAEVDELATLLARGEKLDRQGGALEQSLEKISVEQRELAARIRAAAKGGLDFGVVVDASRTLGSLVEWLGGAAEAVARLDAIGEDLAKRATALDAARAELRALGELLVEARRAVEGARAERDESKRVLQEARQRWAAAHDADRRRRERQQVVERSATELALARESLAVAQRDARLAADELARAEVLLADSQRRHAAAHAAAGRSAGDACPVCDRKLPASWRAPAAPDTDAAASACEKARLRDTSCRAQLSKLEERASNVVSRSGAEKEALKRAEHELAERIRLLRELAGAGAALAQKEEIAIAPLARALTVLEERLAAAEREDKERDAQHAERQSALHSQAAEAITQQKHLDAERARLARQRHDWARRAASLPEALRPVDLEAGAAEAALLRAEQELATARQRQDRSEGLAREEAELRSSLAALKKRQDVEVHRPMRAIARRLGDLWRHLESLAALLEADAPERSECESVSEALAWARELAIVSDALLARVTKRAKEQARVLDGAEKEMEKALRGAGVETEAALVERRADAEVRVRLAAEEVAGAQAQIDVVCDLDHRLATTEPFLAELRDLRSLLTDGRFVGYVVEKKQRSLLAVASKLLGEMTRERYAFSEDFEVLDRLTGEPRSVKTLSGGETFLASLALALGLVELAGREGGRLDSLFLDEGFGSLDANTLIEALDALQDQAAKGRLVAVISHLRAVAENIERVLLVTRTPGGSRAEWLGAAQRAAFVEEDPTLLT